MIVNYFIVPRKLYPEVMTQTPKKVTITGPIKGYNKCFAHKHSLLNKFEIRADFDYEFTIKDNKAYTRHEATKGHFEAKNCLFNLEDQKITKPIFQIATPYVFYTKETCYFEEHQSFYGPPFRLITGKFDISSWLRNIMFAYEIDEDVKEIKIKRGDILGQISFTTNKIEPITLKFNDTPSEKLIRLVNDNSKVLKLLAGTRSAYTLFERGKEVLRKLIK